MSAMSAKKCPICGKTTAGGECYSCGFVFPNEEKIAAPYDLDPSNDLFGEAEAGKNAPAMETIDMGAAMQSLELPKMESLSAGSVNPVGVGLKSPAYPPPNIKVRNAAPPAYPSPAAQPKPQPLNNNPPPPPPAYPVYPPADPMTSFVKAVVNFVTAHWWQFLLTLLLPTVGIGFGVYYFTKFRENRLVRNLLFGIGFTLASMILWIKGVDILGIDYYLRELLDRDYYY